MASVPGFNDDVADPATEIRMADQSKSHVGILFTPVPLTEREDVDSVEGRQKTVCDAVPARGSYRSYRDKEDAHDP